MVGTIHKTQKFLTERYSDCHLAEVDYSSSLSPSAGNQPLSRGVQRRIRRLMLITHILRLSLPRNAHEPLSMRELHTVHDGYARPAECLVIRCLAHTHTEWLRRFSVVRPRL